MKQILKYLLITFIVFGLYCGVLIWAVLKCQPKYYDGEGNVLDQQDIELLVKSQYIKVSDKDNKRLDTGFYGTKHF